MKKRINGNCKECKPIDCDEYFKLLEEGKREETERVICRIRKKVDAIIYRMPHMPNI